MSAWRKKLEELTPPLRDKAVKFLGALDLRWPTRQHIISWGIRHPETQLALYAQGRMPTDSVNAYRKQAGMGPILPGQNNVVTWTKTSRHFPGPDGLSRAFDIAIVGPDGALLWDPKMDGDHNKLSDWKDIADMAEKDFGLKAGYYFTNKEGKQLFDSCHFELR